MKTLLLGLVAGATLATGATAQYAPQAPGGWNRDAFWRGAPMGARERIGFLQNRINRGISDGSLNRGEARSALRELDSIRRMDRGLHYRDRGPLTPGDEAAMQRRLDDLSRRIRWSRHNGW